MPVNRITMQESLNHLAGFSGALRTKQECLNALAGTPGSTLSSNISCNLWAGTTALLPQDALNVEASLARNAGHTKQDAVLIKDGYAV